MMTLKVFDFWAITLYYDAPYNKLLIFNVIWNMLIRKLYYLIYNSSSALSIIITF